MKKSAFNTRRSSLKFLASMGALTLAPLQKAWAQSSTRTFRVGWQKGSNIALLRARGNLDARLKKEGINVRWIEFTAGPQMLEGLNVGSIDFACVGETPPIFAQAAGADLVYVASEPPAPKAEKILVQKDSTLKSFKELKGKRVALNRGSNVHYLLLKVLEREGLAYSDIEVKYLPPADARAAFESGSIDAWVIWDPFAQAAIEQIGARVLVAGHDEVHNYNFYLSTGAYAKARPDVLKWTIEQVDITNKWTLAHFDEAADILSPQIGLSREITRHALENYAYGVAYITDAVARNQQNIADAFSSQKLIPRPLEIKNVIWRP
ncbi:ABC transporter substrate-binding protein [Advenella kashmirensis W13003]|uniref:Putative aliphatic sulfonates-binding protein n=1 Tax=Advenella kashmirensis W13003 TaxID=1424334 RepID=V8QSL5_9BURK|nr:aliphatic sulfonate ABC transporter substrate-binding protein [Advenella kashmirensis]ETF02607.1 ABC transporter substrate-binding protein [Advenella kashmirensis W13003]